jgi:hypothetical protein
MTTFAEMAESSQKKFSGWIKDSWPSIYIALNDFLHGFIAFLKDTIASVFGKY